MLNPIILLSGDTISRDDLSNFTIRHGGFVNEDRSLDNRVSENTSHVWYAVSKEDLDDAIADIEGKFFEQFGKMPQTCLILERSSDQQALGLALRLVTALSREWPIVIVSFEGDLLEPDKTLTL